MVVEIGTNDVCGCLWRGPQQEMKKSNRRWMENAGNVIGRMKIAYVDGCV